MAEEQESEELLSDTQDPMVEGTVVSMELATIELDSASAAATLLNNEGKEHLSNGNITIKEEVLLISFEDPKLLDSTNKPHPPTAKESRELFRKRLKLVLSKRLFFVLGAFLFAAGCVLAVSFQHSNINELCTLDDATSMTV